MSAAPANLGEALDALAPFLPAGVDFTLAHYAAYRPLLGRIVLSLASGREGGLAGADGSSSGPLVAMPLSQRMELAEEEYAIAVDREAERAAKARTECAAKAVAVDLLAVGRKIMDRIEAGQASPLPDVLVGELALALSAARVPA